MFETDLKIATACHMLHLELQNYPGCTYQGTDEHHAELYAQLKYLAYDLLPAEADADDICNCWYTIQNELAAST